MPESDITMFVCANCARPGAETIFSGQARPVVPDFGMPGRVEQVVLPCAGRLQPEHVLRAFEAGSSIVSVVACKGDNCHHAEGSLRCALRIDYIRSLLNEIGLGDGRLVLSHLPGSAAEDLAAAAGRAATASSASPLEAQILELKTRMTEALRAYPSSPLSAPAAGQDGRNE